MGELGTRRGTESAETFQRPWQLTRTRVIGYNSRTTLTQADELVGAKPAFDPKSVQFSNPGSELLGNTPVLSPTEVSASVCVHVCTYMYKYNTEPLI